MILLADSASADQTVWDAQADLGLCWLHLHEDTFLYSMAQI